MCNIKRLALFLAVGFLLGSHSVGAADEAEEKSSKVRLGYKQGLFIKTDDGKFMLKTNVQLQPQYQYLRMQGQGTTNTFQIRRARIIWRGNAFTPKWTFKFEFEAVGGRINTTRDSGAVARGPNLRDAWINYAPWEVFQVQVGQARAAHLRGAMGVRARLIRQQRSPGGFIVPGAVFWGSKTGCQRLT